MTLPDITTITAIPEDVTYSTDLIYFRSAVAEMTPGIVTRLEKDTLCNIRVCNSWNALITQISISVALGNTLQLILVDATMFEQKDATVNEIVSMISTMNRCIQCSTKMSVGVVVETACRKETIMSLQDADVLGIVPCVQLLGYEKTLLALVDLLQAKRHWPREVTEIITGTVPKRPKPRGISLTPRQSQVLTLVCNRGLSNKRIAQALDISESTVKIHMSAIFKEYGVRNRTQLVVAATSTLKP